MGLSVVDSVDIYTVNTAFSWSVWKIHVANKRNRHVELVRFQVKLPIDSYSYVFM